MQALPERMQAVAITPMAGQAALEMLEKPVPKPAADEVLVRVHAAGVNRADLFQVAGTYPFPHEAQGVPGLECAGEVVAVGAKVTRWKLGDAVCGIMQAGGYAQYALLHQDHSLPVPTGMTMAQAACLPEAMATSYMALFELGQVARGQRALVHGGTSGVGVMALQMLRHAGVEVFATAGSDVKCAAIAALNAHPVNYRTQDFVQVIKEATAGEGVQVVLEMVGGEYIERSIRCLSVGGHLVSIAFLQGAKIQANMAGLLMKDAHWHGMRLRAQSDAMKARIMRALEARFWPAVASGEIKVVQDTEFALQDAQKAHDRMQEGLHIGKIVLSMMPL